MAQRRQNAKQRWHKLLLSFSKTVVSCGRWWKSRAVSRVKDMKEKGKDNVREAMKGG
jgi:hypothetical protein